VAQKAGNIIDAFLTLPDRTVKRNIDENELYGDWTITVQSLNFIDKQQSDYPDWKSITFPVLTFKLKTDNTVEAWLAKKYIPISIFEYPEDVIDSTVISGIWKIEKDTLYKKASDVGYGNKLNLKFDFKGNRIFFINLDISEQNGKLILWSYIGDPDNLYYQEFMKK
jgi:hypothetical protein